MDLTDIMSSALAASAAPRDLVTDEGPLTVVPAPPSERASRPTLVLDVRRTPFARSAVTARELAAVVFATLALHVGVAAAARQDPGEARAPRRLSKVEIDLARPPEPPKPLVTPPVVPPPPKLVKQDTKPVATPQNPTTEPPSEEPPASNDTGSSAAAAEDGELYAGEGGLGVAPPAPRPAAPAPPPAVEPVVQAREGANYLNNPRPAYPRRALRERITGTTLLRVQVHPSGKPGTIQVQKSSGSELLDEAASEAVAKWTFVPATRGGKPTNGWVTVPIQFRLQ